MSPDISETVISDPARSNSQFLDSSSRIKDETEATDIRVDFLDGDSLIIDKSLDVAIGQFDSIDTTIEEIFDDLSIDDSSDLSINSNEDELFKVSSFDKLTENNLEELLISLSIDEDSSQVKSFIF